MFFVFVWGFVRGFFFLPYGLLRWSFLYVDFCLWLFVCGFCRTVFKVVVVFGSATHNKILDLRSLRGKPKNFISTATEKREKFYRQPPFRRAKAAVRLRSLLGEGGSVSPQKKGVSPPPSKYAKGWRI